MSEQAEEQPYLLNIWDGKCAGCGIVVGESGPACRYGQCYCSPCYTRLETEEDAAIEGTPQGAIEYLEKLDLWSFMRGHLDQAADPKSNVLTNDKAWFSFNCLDAFLSRRSDAMVRVARKYGVDPKPLTRFIGDRSKRRENYAEASYFAHELSALLKGVVQKPKVQCALRGARGRPSVDDATFASYRKVVGEWNTASAEGTSRKDFIRSNPSLQAAQAYLRSKAGKARLVVPSAKKRPAKKMRQASA